MAATRSPQEVFDHHAQALAAKDLEEVVAAGVQHGKDGIRQAFTKLLGEVPQATWDLKTTIYEDDILFLEWGAEGSGNRIQDTVDTFHVPRRPDPGPDRPLHPAAGPLTEGKSHARGR